MSGDLVFGRRDRLCESSWCIIITILILTSLHALMEAQNGTQVSSIQLGREMLDVYTNVRLLPLRLFYPSDIRRPVHFFSVFRLWTMSIADNTGGDLGSHQQLRALARASE